MRMANGGETAVTGVIKSPVVWDNITREMKCLIVLGLQQEVYLEIDFWLASGMSVVSKGVKGNVNEARAFLF